MNKTRALMFYALITAGACSETTTPAQPIVAVQSTPSLAVQGVTERFPFWERGPACCVDDHVMIYFYVTDPSAVPSDFNLLGFQFDARALGAEFAVAGFNLRDDATDPAPRKTHLKGVAPVPFWFIPRPLFEEAASDGFLSVSELQGEESLIRGYADHFQEELHPSPPAKAVHLSTTAKGTLTGGGTFRASVVLTNSILRVDGRLGTSGGP